MSTIHLSAGSSCRSFPPRADPAACPPGDSPRTKPRAPEPVRLPPPTPHPHLHHRLPARTYLDALLLGGEAHVGCGRPQRGEKASTQAFSRPSAQTTRGPAPGEVQGRTDRLPGAGGRVSAREPPGKSRRNWVRRAAARPRASCGSRSSEEGAPRPLPQALRTTKRQEKGGTRAPGPSRTWKPLEALQPLPPTPPRALPPHPPPLHLRGPQRARTSTSDPTPQSPVRSAEWEALGCSFVSGVPTTSRPYCRGSGEGRHSVCYRHLANPRAPRSQKKVRKGSGLLTATGEWRSARRGALLPSGDPRVHHGSMCAQVQALPPSENPCSVGGVLLLRETERSGQSGDLRVGGGAGALAGNAAGGRMGCALGAPGRGGSRESSLVVRWVAPGAGAAQVQLGLAQAPAKGSGARRGTQWPGRGRPFWAGSQLGMEDGAEVVKWRGAGSGSASPSAALALIAVWVSPGNPEACSRKAGHSSAGTPAFGAHSPTPCARPAVSRTGGHNSSEAAVTPGGSSCPAPAGLRSRCSLCFPAGNPPSELMQVEVRGDAGEDAELTRSPIVFLSPSNSSTK
ncbi:hypothetical protein Cadr_000004498 [Camelus dromedarius]|uniref:Uncharacterized protein n=1 Tax=Camelus dromedarius TaxID=9838 RepID=A0A5N4EBD0_CAMDR|nr:hypothetical protein Cadr_000004498 [Camelus dromedarius]